MIVEVRGEGVVGDGDELEVVGDTKSDEIFALPVVLGEDLGLERGVGEPIDKLSINRMLSAMEVDSLSEAGGVP